MKVSKPSIMMTRANLIKWCQAWDKDGDYSDQIMIANGYTPLTKKEAYDAAMLLWNEYITNETNHNQGA